MSKVTHLVEHSCGPQECDCAPTCHIAAEEIQTTGFVKDTTCKRCLGMLAARGRRSDRQRRQLLKSLEAWAEECAS